MKTKICSKCKKRKSIKEFYKRNLSLDKLSYVCKSCMKNYEEIHKKSRKEYIKKWRNKNKKQIQKYNIQYKKTHKKVLIEKKKIWYRKNKKQILKKLKEYNQKNPEKLLKYRQEHKQDMIKYMRERRRTDINFRLANNLRKRIGNAFKNNSKSAKTIKLLGCTILKLKQHLENQFTKGMTWDNYGKWHIDHIKPLVTFNLKLPSQQFIAFNYKNLRPLWAIENQSRPKDGSDI